MNSAHTLVIDTSNMQASLGLFKEGQQSKISSLPKGQRQGANLIPLLDALLQESCLALEDLKDLVIHVGPGSHTGLRMGIVLVQGLSHRLPNLSIRPVGLEDAALCALPENTEHNRALLLAEAQGGEFFIQEYAKNAFWRKGGQLEIMSYEQVEAMHFPALVLGLLDKALAKVNLPKEWDWLDVGEKRAEIHKNPLGITQLPLSIFYEAGKIQPPISVQELDVRYLRQSQAEINWQKNKLNQ